MFDVFFNRLNGSIFINVIRFFYLCIFLVVYNKFIGFLLLFLWGFSSVKIIKVDCSDNFFIGSILEGLFVLENLIIF